MRARNQAVISARSYRQYFEELRAPAGAISGRGRVHARATAKQAQRAKSAGVFTEKDSPQ